MKPAPFTYAAPSTLEEAITLLGEHGDAVKLLAGGQSLMPMLNLRLARPQYIVDLNRIPGLDYVTERDGSPGGWGADAPAQSRARTERAAGLSPAVRGHHAHRPSGDSQPGHGGRKHRPR